MLLKLIATFVYINVTADVFGLTQQLKNLRWLTPFYNHSSLAFKSSTSKPHDRTFNGMLGELNKVFGDLERNESAFSKVTRQIEDEKEGSWTNASSYNEINMQFVSNSSCSSLDVGKLGKHSSDLSGKKTVHSLFQWNLYN